MNQMSEDGRWFRGQEVTLNSGPCDGHECEVLNPSVLLPQSIVNKRKTKNGDVTITRTGMIESVIIRCMKDFRSMTFPALMDVPEAGRADQTVAEVLGLVYDALGAETEESDDE